MDELEVNSPPIAFQLDVYAKMKHLQSQMVRMWTEIIDMKRQMRKDTQRWEQIIDCFGEGLQNQQILFDSLASHLLASVLRNELWLNAPMFFHDNTNNHSMDEGIRPLTLEEFCVNAPNQIHLFYSQGSTRQAVYKESMLKF